MRVEQLDAKRHVRRCHLDIEVLEHRDQIRVRPIVEHKKTRIDWIVDAIDGNVDGIGVAAKCGVLLKQRDLMCATRMTRQQPRRREPRNTGTDHRNFQNATRMSPFVACDRRQSLLLGIRLQWWHNST